jgi:hypothetical protein
MREPSNDNSRHRWARHRVVLMRELVPSTPLASLRWFLARHPWIVRTALGALLVVAAADLQGKRRDLDARRAQWGAEQTVLIVVHDIAPGESIGEDDVRRVAAPVSLGPRDVAVELGRDTIALDRLVEGEIVLQHHLVPGDGLASGLPVGMVGVVVPWSSALTFSAGDLVVAVQAVDPIGLDTAGPASVGPTEGVVVAAVEGEVLVALPESVAAEMARSAADGRLALVLRRGDGQPGTGVASGDAGRAGDFSQSSTSVPSP